MVASGQVEVTATAVSTNDVPKIPEIRVVKIGRDHLEDGAPQAINNEARKKNHSKKSHLVRGFYSIQSRPLVGGITSTRCLVYLSVF